SSEDGVLGRSRESARRAGRAGQHRVRGDQPLERGRIDKFGDDLAEQSQNLLGIDTRRERTSGYREPVTSCWIEPVHFLAAACPGRRRDGGFYRHRNDLRE